MPCWNLLTLHNLYSRIEKEDFEFMTTGQYGGIDYYHQKWRLGYISEPYEGFPADKAG